MLYTDVSKRGQHGGDILWTMHTHTPEVVAISCRKEGLVCGLSQYAMDLGGISYHEFEHATKKGSDVCQRLVKDLGQSISYIDQIMDQFQLGKRL